MHLVMFDIDGTLTASFEFDKECFVSALMDVLNTDDIDSDWSTYQYVSSTGITTEAFQRHTGRNATEGELRKVEARLMFHLSERFRNSKSDFIEVPGAKQLVNELQLNNNIAISLATGCWKDEALFKLRKTGFDVSSIPLASSNDGMAREDIMSTSLKLAKESYGVKEFESVTYVGDGIWDLRSANNLGYQFIGVGDHIEMLKENGANNLHRNFLDIDAFFNTLSNPFRS